MSDTDGWRPIAGMKHLAFTLHPAGSGEVLFGHKPGAVSGVIPLDNLYKDRPMELLMGPGQWGEATWFKTVGQVSYDEGATLAASMLE